MAAMSSYMNMQGSNNSNAMNWGSSMDMSKIPSWAQGYFAENVMYTRTFLASNPEVQNADGSVNLGNLNGAPAMIPADMANVQNNAAATSSSAPSSSSASSTASSSASTASGTAASDSKKSGAIRSFGSSGALVGAVAVVGAFLAL